MSRKRNNKGNKEKVAFCREKDLHAPLRGRQQEILSDVDRGDLTLANMASKYDVSTSTMGCYLESLDGEINLLKAQRENRRRYLDNQKRKNLEGELSDEESAKSISHITPANYLENRVVDPDKGIVPADSARSKSESYDSNARVSYRDKTDVAGDRNSNHLENNAGNNPSNTVNVNVNTGGSSTSYDSSAERAQRNMSDEDVIILKEFLYGSGPVPKESWLYNKYHVAVGRTMNNRTRSGDEGIIDAEYEIVPVSSSSPEESESKASNSSDYVGISSSTRYSSGSSSNFWKKIRSWPSKHSAGISKAVLGGALLLGATGLIYLGSATYNALFGGDSNKDSKAAIGANGSGRESSSDTGSSLTNKLSPGIELIHDELAPKPTKFDYIGIVGEYNDCNHDGITDSKVPERKFRVIYHETGDIKEIIFRNLDFDERNVTYEFKYLGTDLRNITRKDFGKTRVEYSSSKISESQAKKVNSLIDRVSEEIRPGSFNFSQNSIGFDDKTILTGFDELFDGFNSNKVYKAE